MHHVWQEVDEWQQLGQLWWVNIAMATKSTIAGIVKSILTTRSLAITSTSDTSKMIRSSLWGEPERAMHC